MNLPQACTGTEVIHTVDSVSPLMLGLYPSRSPKVSGKREETPYTQGQARDLYPNDRSLKCSTVKYKLKKRETWSLKKRSRNWYMRCSLT